VLLGVNIDHIALLREARRINDPDPLEAMYIAKRAGADQITIHLREDRRHINDCDARRVVENSPLPVNIECSVDPEIVEVVSSLKPSRVTLVPEKRDEVTTEGGLDIKALYHNLDSVVKSFQDCEIEVSLFIDPNYENIKTAKELGVEWVELHTGEYANIYSMLESNLSRTAHSIKDLELSKKSLRDMLTKAIEDITKATKEANRSGLKVAAGHGLNYQNVVNIVSIGGILELNIGQSIVARSIFSGFYQAVKDMRLLL
jgi:pyridoxine 5-phosphate synthase